MREERHEEQKKGHKKKKTHRLYAAIVLSLGIVIICLTLMILFYVQRIEIQGNEYCTDKEIAEIIQNDRFSINTLYVVAKYKTGKGEVPAGIESMSVRLKNPWTLSVSVVEKKAIGYFEHKKKRVYFDKEGTVILNGLIIVKDIPVVEGIKFKNVKQYKQLDCENPAVFDEINFTVQEMEKQELAVDKILYIDDRMYVYTGRICVSLGMDVTEDKIAQIKPIKKKLKKKKGTLHLENYSTGNETITFAIGEFPEEN